MEPIFGKKQDKRDQVEIDYDNAIKKQELKEKWRFNKAIAQDDLSDNEVESLCKFVMRTKDINDVNKKSPVEQFLISHQKDIDSGRYDAHPKLKDALQEVLDRKAEKHGYDIYPIDDGIADNNPLSLQSINKRMSKKSRKEDVEPYNSFFGKLSYAAVYTFGVITYPLTLEQYDYLDNRDLMRKNAVKKRERFEKKELKEEKKQQKKFQKKTKKIRKQNKEMFKNKINKDEFGPSDNKNSFCQQPKRPKNTRSRIKPQLKNGV